MNINILTIKDVEKIVELKMAEIDNGFIRRINGSFPTKKFKEKLLKEEDKIDLLNLSVRASNCLYNNNIFTIKDLCSKTEQDLYHIRNFGKRTLMEIRIQLCKVGYDLKNIPEIL